MAYHNGGGGESAFLRSLVGANSRRMCVPKWHIQQLMEIASDDMVTSIFGRLVPDIRADGLRLGFREFDDVRPADPDKATQFSKAWRQLSYDEPYHQLLVGYTVKRRVSVARAVAEKNNRNRANNSGGGGGRATFSAHDADEVTGDALPSVMDESASGSAAAAGKDAPFVISPLLYSLQWEDTTSGPRQYVAVDLNNQIMTDVVIHVSAEPDPQTGVATSPTAKMLQWLLLRRQLFFDVAYGSYWATHNTLAVQSVGMASTPNPNDLEYYAEGMVRGEQQLFERTYQDVATNTYQHAVGQLQSAQMANAHAYQAAYGTRPGSALYAAAMQGAPMMQPPYQRALVLGPGKQLASVSAPTVPPQIEFVIQQLHAAMLNLFGMTPNMLANAGARVIAQADNDRKLYETKKQEWQALIEHFHTETYNALYDDAFVAYAAELEHAIRGDAPNQMRGARGMRKRIMTTVRENVKAEISIARLPPATLEEIQLLADRGWISEQTAAEAAVRIVGLSAAAVTSESEREHTKQLALDQEVDHTERLSFATAAGKPAPAGSAAIKRPGGAKPAAPKRPKPAAASSSASSSSSR